MSVCEFCPISTPAYVYIACVYFNAVRFFCFCFADVEEDLSASAAIAAATAAAAVATANGHVDGNAAADAAAAAVAGTGNGSGNGSGDDCNDGGGDDDEALSAVWYLAAFGGLVLFFFVVTCSELFLDNPVHARRQLELPHARDLRRHWRQRNSSMAGYFGPETPPPPYHQFAPPSYDDFIKSEKQKRPHLTAKPPAAAAAAAADFDKPKVPDVYIVPVHNREAAVVSVATTAARAALDSVAISAAELQKQLDAVTPRAKCHA